MELKTLTVIPTYNELEALPVVIERLRAAQPEVHVLVVDDNSPDGTGELADRLSREDEKIHVLHRKGKGGLGAAYIAGFTWGMERDYDVLVEMDADCSHQPEQLGRLLEAVERGADLAIGSRYVPGGKTVNWPWHRQFLSRGANFYAQTMLGTDVRDITAGYRAFRRGTLERLDLETIDSVGYCFQIDLGWRAELAGLTITEVPITFVEREVGDSKMDSGVILESMTKVARWGLGARAKTLCNKLRAVRATA
ncbi:polyprenol monophosphomannose synthase [Rothia koreensis]|uniref:polyprenol monophosphomannose synthase n=1 Tax=Rothia koreensis TaxID=592378 RepID=UPI0015B8B311